MIKTLGEGAFQGYTGPCYMQPSQMNFAPIESSAATDPSASGSQPEENTGPMFLELAGTTVPPHIDHVFTNSAPITTTVQGGSASGFPIRWDPVTGFGMPPQFFTSSSTEQVNPSASAPMAH